MLRHHALVFDDFLTPSATSATTSIKHAAMLGGGDQIGLHALLSQCGGTATFSAAIEHSTDGIQWAQKNGAPEINAIAVSTTQTTSAYGGEVLPGKPSLEFVRIRVWLASGTGPLHVRLYAVVRDQHKGEAHDCACPGREGESQEREGERLDLHAEVVVLAEQRPHEALSALGEQLELLDPELSFHERLRQGLTNIDDESREAVLEHLERLANVAELAEEETSYVG